jgi:hypothetical protein
MLLGDSRSRDNMHVTTLSLCRISLNFLRASDVLLLSCDCPEHCLQRAVHAGLRVMKRMKTHQLSLLDSVSDQHDASDIFRSAGKTAGGPHVARTWTRNAVVTASNS